MICRMNRRQREALIAMVDTIAKSKAPGADLGDLQDRLNAEDDFHRCFENESSEDEHNHAG